MLLLAAPKSLAWGCNSPMFQSQIRGRSSCGSAVAWEELGLILQGSNVWMGEAGGGMCAELLKHLCVQKPIASSWGNSEDTGYFWRLNCDILIGTETASACSGDVSSLSQPCCDVPRRLWAKGAAQLCSWFGWLPHSPPSSKRQRGKDLQGWPGLHPQDRIKLV